MASSKEYLTFILEQLSDLEGISYRAMMGEYIIYYREKIVGGIYDDRLLVKPVKSAVSLMPNAIYELPYDGAKEMLLVDNVDNKNFLTRLFVAMYGYNMYITIRHNLTDLTHFILVSRCKNNLCQFNIPPEMLH